MTAVDPTSGPSTTLPRVLFVDDDRDVCELFSDTVSQRGFTVDVAYSGSEAIHLGQQHSYAIVVTDLRMPGMDGYSVIENLRGRQDDAAFVVVTGLPEIDQKRMKDLGSLVTEVVAKPWDELRLLTTLSRALELRSHAVQKVSESRVLILQDQRDDAHQIARQMAHLNDNTVVRITGLVSEAIEILHDGPVEVVLADLSLPDAVGLDVVRRIGMAAPGTPIVILTGQHDDELGLRAIQLGAQDYLVKGQVDGPSLRRAVRHAIARKRASQLMTHLAHRDPLTGLANRLTFRDRLGHAMSVARRVGTQVAVVYADLDEFKPVNDTYGHDIGDMVLQEVALRLQASVRGSDTVARLGGDEFAVVVEEIREDDQLAQLLGRIRSVFGQTCIVGGHPIEMSASLGVAVFPGDGATPDELVRTADRAMYRVKRSANVPTDLLDNPGPEREMVRLRFHRDLHQGLANDEFVLHFQPQFDLKTGVAAGLEALLRWRRAGSAEPLPPGEFVPALEDTGLIVDVGRWVLSAACQHVRQLHDRGAKVRVAVNVSPVQFATGGLVDAVLDALSTSGLDPDYLELEMTERTMMRDTPAVNDTLVALKNTGVRLTVDDFGTGYASLGYLNRFKVDALKIDKSFIRNIAAKPGASIADAIVDIGHRLGLIVVAEGVENEDQLRLLRDRGCDLAQGFLLGRPLPTWSTKMLSTPAFSTLPSA